MFHVNSPLFKADFKSVEFSKCTGMVYERKFALNLNSMSPLIYCENSARPENSNDRKSASKSYSIYVFKNEVFLMQLQILALHCRNEG